METIKMTAIFDEISSAENASALIKSKIKNLSSIKLNSKVSKNKTFNNKIMPDYGVNSSLFGGSAFSYYGSVGPVTPGVAYNSASYDVPAEFDNIDISYNKTKMTIVVDKNYASLASTLILSSGGHNIHTN